MTVISLVFLFVYLFGAYAYGAATVLSVREVGPIWGRPARDYTPGVRRRIDKASLALFVISTIWFVLHILIEFRNFIGFTREGWLDLATLMVFLFPPVIMHTVYLESQCGEEAPPPPLFRWLLGAMYALSISLGVYMVAALLEKVPRPDAFGMFIGGRRSAACSR